MGASSFQLLWCETCGRAETGPHRGAGLPSFVDSGPLMCVECNEPITLLDAELSSGGRNVSGRWQWTMSDIRRRR